MALELVPFLRDSLRPKSLLPGTSVPGFQISPLQGWNLLAPSTVSPRIQVSRTIPPQAVPLHAKKQIPRDGAARNDTAFLAYPVRVKLHYYSLREFQGYEFGGVGAGVG